MIQPTPDDQRRITEIAARHQVSSDAVLTLFAALQKSRGRQAQFNHPELGGMGQWSRGGMVMVGDMFNTALKARVDHLCNELATWIDRTAVPSSASVHSQGQVRDESGTSVHAVGAASAWWPTEFGFPASAGSQNNTSYAYFPAIRRLAINHGGRLSIYDSGDHRISGVSQQQSADQSITFMSQLGIVSLEDLQPIEVGSEDRSPELHGVSAGDTAHQRVPAPASAFQPFQGKSAAGTAGEDILGKIERLAEMHCKGILTEEEFTAKKADLLSRF